MAEIMEMKVGNTSPSMKYILELETGQTLVAATARFVMGPKNGGVTVDRACTVDEAGTALIQDWQAGDTDIAGNYHAEFHVTYSDGSVETFPNGLMEYLYVRITPLVQ